MLMLAISCSNDFNQSLDTTDAPYVEGEILVKFSTDVAQMIDQLSVEGARVQTLDESNEHPRIITTGRAGGLHKPPWGMSQAEPIGS